MAEDIVERLLATKRMGFTVSARDDDDPAPPVYVNPDGPDAAAEITALRKALHASRDAIASLDADALGMVVISPKGDDDFGNEYPVRDELLASIDAALGERTG